MIKNKETGIILSDGNAYRLNYTEWGKEDASHILLCVHGLTRNGRDFDYLAMELANKHNYRVICPDIFGRGKSEYLPDPKLYNYENYKIAILALLKTLGLEKIDYLGSSMGGLIAMHMAQDNANLFNKLILNDIGTYLPKTALIRIARYINIFPKFRDLAHAKEHLKVKLANFGVKLEKNWDYLTLHSTRLNNDGELVLDYDLHVSDSLSSLKNEEILDVDYSAFWPAVKSNKLLMLRGANSDLFREETAQFMLKSRDNATLIEFADTGHAPALMEKDQLDAVINWLLS